MRLLATLQRQFGKILTFAFFSWLLVATIPLSAEVSPTPVPVDSLRQMQQQLKQQHSNYSQEHHRVSTLQKTVQGQLSGLQQNIQLTDTQLKNYEAQLQHANQRLKTLQKDLTIALQSYGQKQSATVGRLRFLQRQQMSNQGWALLLSSQNFSQFFDRRRQLRLVFQADQQSLKSLKAEADQIDRQKQSVEQQKNQISLLTQQLLAQKAQFEDQSKVQQQLIARLNNDRIALEAAQSQLAQDSQSIGVLIQKLVAEQQAKEAKEAARKAVLPNPGLTYGTGQLSHPSNASITSNFGWRVHPILGTRRFHSGLDFGASYGSTIRSADNGTVIFSGWYGGYGYAVIINHGDGITTLYGHSSKLFVSEGQSVQRGEAIATVGSTGLSTGPHLHFEVRQNGTPVDPTKYL